MDSAARILPFLDAANALVSPESSMSLIASRQRIPDGHLLRPALVIAAVWLFTVFVAMGLRWVPWERAEGTRTVDGSGVTEELDGLVLDSSGGWFTVLGKDSREIVYLNAISERAPLQED